MCPRLKCRNLMWYSERVQLDRDILILEKALNGKVPDFDPSEDWKLPILIKQYKNRNVNMCTPTAWGNDESRPSCSSTRCPWTMFSVRLGSLGLKSPHNCCWGYFSSCLPGFVLFTFTFAVVYNCISRFSFTCSSVRFHWHVIHSPTKKGHIIWRNKSLFSSYSLSLYFQKLNKAAIWYFDECKKHQFTAFDFREIHRAISQSISVGQSNFASTACILG